MELENWKYKLRDAFLYFIYFYMCFNLHKHEGVSEFWEPRHTKNIIICSYFRYLCNLNTTNCTFFHLVTKTALSSSVLVHRCVTGCVRWRMKDETFSDRHKDITEMNNFFSFDSYQAKCHFQSGEWTDFDPEENKVGQSNKCIYWETAEIVLLMWDLFLCCFLSTDIQSYNQKDFVKKISTTS